MVLKTLVGLSTYRTDDSLALNFCLLASVLSRRLSFKEQRSSCVEGPSNRFQGCGNPSLSMAIMAIPLLEAQTSLHGIIVHQM